MARSFGPAENRLSPDRPTLLEWPYPDGPILLWEWTDGARLLRPRSRIQARWMVDCGVSIPRSRSRSLFCSSILNTLCPISLFFDASEKLSGALSFHAVPGRSELTLSISILPRKKGKHHGLAAREKLQSVWRTLADLGFVYSGPRSEEAKWAAKQPPSPEHHGTPSPCVEVQILLGVLPLEMTARWEDLPG